MKINLVRSLGLAGLLTVGLFGPAVAQDASQGPKCMFPLLCPGPVPPVPPPLLGAPEEQAEAPPPVEPVVQHKRAVHKKHAHKPAA